MRALNIARTLLFLGSVICQLPPFSRLQAQNETYTLDHVEGSTASDCTNDQPQGANPVLGAGTATLTGTASCGGFASFSLNVVYSFDQGPLVVKSAEVDTYRTLDRTLKFSATATSTVPKVSNAHVYFYLLDWTGQQGADFTQGTHTDSYSVTTDQLEYTASYNGSGVPFLSARASVSLELYFDSTHERHLTVTLTAYYKLGEPTESKTDDIAILEYSFDPPLNQPLNNQGTSPPIYFHVAYTLGSADTGTIECYTQGSSGKSSSTYSVKRGTSVLLECWLNPVTNSGATSQTIYAVLQPASGSTKTASFAYAVRAAPTEWIQISNPKPEPPGPWAIRPTYADYTLHAIGLPRYIALRIFDPDSPSKTLLASSDFVPVNAVNESGTLKIPTFSFDAASLTMGRWAMKYNLYDASKSVVLAESGFFIYSASNEDSYYSPTISGVVDAATGGRSLSRGGLVTLYGSHLSLSTNRFGTAPVSTFLDEVQVSVAGINAPLLFVSPTQVNFQMPFEVDTQSTRPVVVAKRDQKSPAVWVAVANYAPAVFTYDSSLDAIAVHPDGTLITPDSPAAPGEVIVVYGTGLGDVDPAVKTGEAAGASQSKVKPRILVGSAVVEVQYSGLAPGFVGLAQFNIKLPNPMPAHGRLPLAIAFDSVLSAPAYLSVR